MRRTKIPRCVYFQGRLVTRGLSCITTLPVRVSGITLLLLKASECSGTLWLPEDGRGRHGPAPWAAKRRNTATLMAAGPMCTASLSMLPPAVSSPSAQQNGFKKREGTLRTHAAARAHLVASTPQHWERPCRREGLRAGEKAATEGEMAAGHHRLNGEELERAPGDGEGQGSLACCGPWGHKESDTTKRPNNNPTATPGHLPFFAELLKVQALRATTTKGNPHIFLCGDDTHSRKLLPLTEATLPVTLCQIATAVRFCFDVRINERISCQL